MQKKASLKSKTVNQVSSGVKHVSSVYELATIG